MGYVCPLEVSLLASAGINAGLSLSLSAVLMPAFSVSCREAALANAWRKAYFRSVCTHTPLLALTAALSAYFYYVRQQRVFLSVITLIAVRYLWTGLRMANAIHRPLLDAAFLTPRSFKELAASWSSAHKLRVFIDAVVFVLLLCNSLSWRIEAASVPG